MDEKEREKFLELYNRMIKENKKDASNFFRKGNKLYDNGNNFYEKEDYQNAIKNFDDAIKNFDDAIKLNSKNTSYFYKRGETYYKLGVISNNENDYQNAIKDFDDAIKLNSKNASYFYKRGNAYYKLGIIYKDMKGKNVDKNADENFNRAITDYLEASCLEPKNASYHNSIGKAFSNKGNYIGNFEDYYNALELNPNYSYAFNNIGVSFAKGDLFEEAIKKFNRAIKLDSNYSLAIENRELSLKILNEFFINRKTPINSSDVDYEKYNELKNKIRIDESIEPEYYSDFHSILALHLSSKTNKDFEKVKKKLSSFITNFKKIPNKSLILENLLKEAELYKIASEENTKRFVGYLIFADILGWKGVWKKFSLTEEKMGVVNRLLNIRNQLENEIKSQNSICSMNLISDTFIIYSQSFEMSKNLSKKLMALCLEKELPIRGAISYGECYNRDTVYVGPAVDEAVSWHDEGEEIGIFYTPSAKQEIINNDYDLPEDFIKLKSGEINTFFINWYNKETKKKFDELFSKIDKSSIKVYLKYLNTEKKFDKYLKEEKK
ncbi:tetratricopeptide repeat protein [Fusobacterium nucleatum]